MAKGQTTCFCSAYKFPHREHGGKCKAKPGDQFCGECGQPCKSSIVDFGIGSYEFWGQRGVDRNEQLASDCCEGEVFEDSKCTIDSIFWFFHP